MVASMSDKLKSTWNSASPAPTNPSSPRTPGATTLACVSLNWPTDTAVDFATFGKNADGSVNQASVQEFTGIVSGNNLTSIVLTSGGADQGNNITEFVVMKPTSKGHQDLVDAVKVAHNQDGSLKDNIVTTGKISDGAVVAGKIDFSTFTNRSNNGSNAAMGKVRVYAGWAGVNMGTTAANKNISIAFGVTFTAPPIVVASFGGDQTSGTIAYGNGGTTVKRASAAARSVSTTGFTAVVDSLDGSSWASGNNVYVQWMAIGEVA